MKNTSFSLQIHCKLYVTDQTWIWKFPRKDSAIRKIREKEESFDQDHVGNREKLVTAFLGGRLNLKKSI